MDANGNIKRSDDRLQHLSSYYNHAYDPAASAAAAIASLYTIHAVAAIKSNSTRDDCDGTGRNRNSAA